MSPALAGPRAAGDQGGTQVGGGEQPAAKSAHHAAPDGRQPGATRITRPAPPAKTSAAPLARQKYPAAQSADHAQQDEGRAAGQRP